MEKQDPNGSGWLPLEERRFTPTSTGEWPLTFETVLPGSIRGTYQLTATARDERDAVIAQARVIQTFDRDSYRQTVRIHFEDGCLMLPKLCGQTETCRHGACVSANMSDSDPPTGKVTGAQMEPPTPDQNPVVPPVGTPMRTTPAPECAGHDAGHAFCDGDTMRDCSDPLAPPIRPCGEHERCVAAGVSVRCGCQIGFVENAGGCQPATKCGTENGGCDSLTVCESKRGVIECSPCPVGYLGDGSSGCVPLLAALSVEPGMLEPAFSPEVTSYKVRASLLDVQVAVRAAVPDGASLTIDGTSVQPGTVWNTPGLRLGRTVVSVVVTSPSDVRKQYELSIERSGGQAAYVKASNPSSLDIFGYRVAVDEDTIVAGAPNEDGASGGVNGNQAATGLSDSGAAYVFARQADTWVQRAYLKAPMPVANEHFGASVAVLGDLIAVGACANDPIDPPTTGSASGAVYLFERAGSTWTFAKRLVAPDAKGLDLFGLHLLLTPSTLFVGAPYESSQATRSGAVYAFDRADSSWMRAEKLKAMRPIAESSFGMALAVDAETLVIGASQDSSSADRGGAAYVFNRQNDAWVEVQRLEPSMPARGATFGSSLAVLGDWMFIGAPRWAHWIETPRGEAFVFRRNGARWAQTEVLTAPHPRDSDHFGAQFILTPSRLVLSASGDWSGEPGLDADPEDASQAYSGAIYLFSIEGDQLVPNAFIKADRPLGSDGLGRSAAVSGRTLVAGAAFDNSDVTGVRPRASGEGRSDSGAVYVFE